MNFFEAVAGWNRLNDFGEAYFSFVKCEQSGDLEGSWQAQQKMASLALAVDRDLHRVGIGSVTLMNAPMLGGGRWNYDLVQVAINKELAKQYSMPPNMVLISIQQAMGEYRRQSIKGIFINLLNP